MNTILKTLGELLETMVREASTEAFKEYDRKLERQQELISDLKESVGMIQRQLRNAGVNLTPQPIIRTSPHDIRNFRKKLGITQEVFAQMLHVHTLTRQRKSRTHISSETIVPGTTLCQAPIRISRSWIRSSRNGNGICAIKSNAFQIRFSAELTISVPVMAAIAFSCASLPT